LRSYFLGNGSVAHPGNLKICGIYPQIGGNDLLQIYVYYDNYINSTMFLAFQFSPSTRFGTWLLGLLTTVVMSCGAAHALTLSGHVYKDSNALVDLTVNGTGTDAGGLFATLLDDTNTVLQVVAVDPGDGS